MNTEPITVVVDSAVSAGAVDLLNTNVGLCLNTLGSIRIILIVFLVWLIICVIYRFFNMFF